MVLVTRSIFEPLRMNSSTFVIGPELEPRVAKGYANRRDGSVNTEAPAFEHAGRGYKVPNGGVYSTVTDLSRFMAAMTGASDHELLSVEGRREMTTIQTPESATSGYGLGFSIRTDENAGVMVGHGGSVAGYNAYIIFSPETQIGVVLLRNYNSGATNLGRAATGLLTELTVSRLVESR